MLDSMDGELTQDYSTRCLTWHNKTTKSRLRWIKGRVLRRPGKRGVVQALLYPIVPFPILTTRFTYFYVYLSSELAFNIRMRQLFFVNRESLMIVIQRDPA